MSTGHVTHPREPATSARSPEAVEFVVTADNRFAWKFMPELIEHLARQIQEKNREAEKNLKGSGVDQATIAQKDTTHST